MIKNGQMPESDRQWAELLQLSQLSTLSLAHMLQAIMDDPTLATPEARGELAEMITELEYSVARFEEYVV